MDVPKPNSAEPLQTGPLDTTIETSPEAAMGGPHDDAQDPSSVVGRPSSLSHTPSGGPTVLTLQDLIDLPGQILPEETRMHLKKAGREAALALYSLWKSVNSSQSSAGGKVRKHIDVE
jgi:hypothetical protein